MRKYRGNNDSEFGPRFYAILLMGCWSLVVILSIYWRINQESHTKAYLAREIARSHLEKDLIIREWNMSHGFVYAPVNPENPPNPLMKMPEREIVTPSGRTFTAINSSTMIQQLYKLAGEKIVYQGHLTSLRPLRPENTPDSWENQALQQLAHGAKEVSDIVNKNEQLYFRLIQPLIATDKCLACHSQTDYTPGKVAGGISVTLPMASVVDAWQKTRLAVFAAHGFLWLIGLLGIAWGAEQLHKKIQSKQEIEMALRQSENNYRILVKNIPALVYRGYTDGRVDFVDEKVEHLTGYSQEEFFTGHKKWPDIILPEDRKGSREIFLHALKAEGAYRREYRIKRKDNEIVWVAERSQIVWDAQGRIEFISGVVFDISLQKDMEQSLQESGRFWRTLLEAVGVGLMVIDKANGRITEVNSQAVAMSGFNREQIIGQERQRFFICPSKPNKIVNSPGWQENCSEGELIKADGTSLPILKTVAPIQTGEMEHLIISFLDLTDQRQAEDALIKANKDLQTAMAEVGQTNKEMILMGRMLELLQICQSPDEAYPVIAQYTQELFPNSSGALYLLNSSNNLVASVSQWGQHISRKANV